MAEVAIGNMQAWGHTAPHGLRTNGSGNPIYHCYVSGYPSGTYVQNDNARFTGVGGASGVIATSRRDNKTVTLLASGVAFVAPGDEAGTEIGVKTLAVSTADITCELTGSDMSTEHAGAALGTITEPVVISCTYVLS